MSTAFGKLAGLLEEIERERTPLQEKLDQFGRWLGTATLIVVAFVAILGIIEGFDPFEMFLWGVALAVAAIPEALPAVVTVGLALGVRRMVKRHGLPVAQELEKTNIVSVQIMQENKTITLTNDEDIEKAVNVVKVLSFHFGEANGGPADTMCTFYQRDGSKIKIGTNNDTIFKNDRQYVGVNESCAVGVSEFENECSPRYAAQAMGIHPHFITVFFSSSSASSYARLP